MNPLAAVGVRLGVPQLAISMILEHANEIEEEIGEDLLLDIQWAIAGDIDAAWRAARGIAPSAAIWFDGIDEEYICTSFWCGDARAQQKFNKGYYDTPRAILSAGIDAYLYARNQDSELS